MDEILYNSLKEAYLRASEIEKQKLPKAYIKSFTITLTGGNEMMTNTTTL